MGFQGARLKGLERPSTEPHHAHAQPPCAGLGALVLVPWQVSAVLSFPFSAHLNYWTLDDISI